jgi:SAM-dependent methyltransferase
MSWESEASNWIAWARAPGHDEYWYYRDSFFDEIVPPAGRATLELGCGEGRVVRDLQELDHRVTGIDAALSLVAAARELDPGGRYLSPTPPPSRSTTAASTWWSRTTPSWT